MPISPRERKSARIHRLLTSRYGCDFIRHRTREEKVGKAWERRGVSSWEVIVFHPIRGKKDESAIGT